MSARKVVGGALLASPFAGIAFMQAAEAGWAAVAVTWAMALGIASTIFVGVWLIMGGGDGR